MSDDRNDNDNDVDVIQSSFLEGNRLDNKHMEFLSSVDLLPQEKLRAFHNNNWYRVDSLYISRRHVIEYSH